MSGHCGLACERWLVFTVIHYHTHVSATSSSGMSRLTKNALPYLKSLVNKWGEAQMPPSTLGTSARQTAANAAKLAANAANAAIVAEPAAQLAAPPAASEVNVPKEPAKPSKGGAKGGGPPAAQPALQPQVQVRQRSSKQLPNHRHQLMSNLPHLNLMPA